ncbi:unnamed protein product [Eruca vesicaria subsp. sativa]|uniref:Uncharacterized protein n=1 Tax=Eruca vesicaria subsp. sativa TaxID=29727 RepID=A0ABC8LGL1_ERUVS|nr:unnamed protein product [Eruca vesicaria subsp. sativa]
MSSVCGGLDYKDAESHSSASSPNKCCNNGSNHHVSVTGSEDAQESDGDDSGNIHQYLNQESKDNTKPISEPLPLALESSDDQGEDTNLATVTALPDMFSESVSAATIIPAIKGSRKKHGKSVEKLRVSWAEDVYDPPPSIASHTRSKRQHQHKSKSSLKKSGKKGHKGSSSSSSSSSSSRGSKDKKSSSSSSPRSKHSRDKFGWASQMPIVAASS